jgi:hypothetical protein
MIAMSQNNKLERDLIYKRSIILVHLFPHTCTSLSKSMTLLSLDPWFDFTSNAMQVQCFVYPYLKLHINLLEVGENKRRQNFAMPWWGNIHHWVIWECHLRSIKWTILLFERNFQKLQVLRCEIGKMTLFRELFHFSTTQGNMLANTTNPTCVKNVLE